MPTKRVRYVPWDGQKALFIQYWQADIPIQDIAQLLGRTPTACVTYAVKLRKEGEGIKLRYPTPDMDPIQPFIMPTGMRYEDDPRAISHRPPRYIPATFSGGYSPYASCIGGGRVVASQKS